MPAVLEIETIALVHEKFDRMGGSKLNMTC